jgi:hypothetical protein
LLVTATVERRVGDHGGDVAASKRCPGRRWRNHDLTFDRGVHWNDPRIDPRLAGDAKDDLRAERAKADRKQRDTAQYPDPAPNMNRGQPAPARRAIGKLSGHAPLPSPYQVPLAQLG